MGFCPGRLTRAQTAVPALDQHRFRRRIHAHETRTPTLLRIRIPLWRRRRCSRARNGSGIAADFRCRELRPI
jgi:hypothetical protein